MTITAQELNDLAKRLSDVKVWETDDNLEKAAIEAAISALLQMQSRAKNEATA